MTAAETAIRTDETELVEAWRAEQLELAGYGAAAAAEIAARHEVDLHVAIEMVSDGCPPELALKILL
jgi:ABC-type phosphate/phosphonate transport system substrate-binding protein